MTKFMYRKCIGLLMVIIGLSYCFTSFYNFYSYLFGDLVIANANIFLMGLGLTFPLFIFIFGIFFYFYQDKEFGSINPFIISTSVMLFAIGILRLFTDLIIMVFIHYTFGIVAILISLLLFLGCIRYKY